MASEQETLDSLLLEHVASSMEKQMAFADFISGRDWRYDKMAGILSFGYDLRFRVQALGTESYVKNTWMWAWANESSHIPEFQLCASKTMHACGKERQIEELISPLLELSNTVNGHYLATIASGVCRSGGYFRGPYEGGALFMLIDERDFPPRRGGATPLQITRTFMETVQIYELSNHRTAFKHYLEYHNAGVAEEGSMVTGVLGNMEMVRAEFLPDGRISTFRTSITARELSRSE
jgi:hypothetical protein